MNKQKLNIKQWSKADRPREKMMAKGSEALSDAELLGILIGSGNMNWGNGKYGTFLHSKAWDRPKASPSWPLWN